MMLPPVTSRMIAHYAEPNADVKGIPDQYTRIGQRRVNVKIT